MMKLFITISIVFLFSLNVFADHVATSRHFVIRSDADCEHLIPLAETILKNNNAIYDTDYYPKIYIFIGDYKSQAQGYLNRIYIEKEPTAEVLAHEIAHIILYHALDGKGTATIHEILAKYAEFKIKRSKNLPVQQP